MSIDRKAFQDSFTLSTVPSWICPTCNKGVLETNKSQIKITESSESRSFHSHPEWDPSCIYGGFVGSLKCSNSSCSELVGIIGKMTAVAGQEYNEDFGAWENVSYNILTPTQFYPPINLFPINKDVPEKVRKVIIQAFSLFWLDLSSCGNKIRTVAESIMDNKKVPKTYINNKRKKLVYSLHQRIERFKKTNSEVADLLMSNKWIGNIGSHQIENLTKNDILDGFEILELVTNKLYETDSIRIKKISKKINKRKKPIGQLTKTKRGR
jgi:hypothetical protein